MSEKKQENLEEISKKISYKNGSVNITALHNKKWQDTLMYLKFETKQKELLNMLLQQFINSKVLIEGFNMNNNIINAFSTNNGIVIIIPEKRIISNIINIYGYLQKSVIKGEQLKYVSDGNYKNLSKDIMDFDVYITGKCKNFSRALSNSGDKKLTRITDGLENVNIKDRENFTTDNDKKLNFGNNIPIELKGEEMMDLAVFLKGIPFIITNKELIPLAKDSLCKLRNKLIFKNTIQEQLKSWKSQCGSIGSPPSNDKGNYKKKVQYILNCMNFMTFIISDLYGFNFEYKNENDLRTVNNSSGLSIRSIKIKNVE